MRSLYSFLAAALILFATAASGLAGIDQFAGSWTNVDPNTRGITKLDIAVTGDSVQVQGWGRCHPTDCDWGTVQAQAFASSVSSDVVSSADTLLAVFNPGFSETTLVISLAGNQLNVESYDQFKDNSGRSNYVERYTFQRAQAPGGSAPGGSTPGGSTPGGSAPGGSTPGGSTPGDSTPGGTIPGVIIPGGIIPGVMPTMINLTGVWNCDDSGTYYVRQLGTTVWWFGEDNQNTPSWSNVMRGTISGSTIYADWSDVPKGTIMQYGKLVIKIESNNKLVATSKTGGFGGSVWTR